MSELLKDYVQGEYYDEYTYAAKVSRYGLTKMPPCIIGCAITGGLHGQEANPNLPETKDQQVKSAIEAYEAGASLIHIHARDPQHPSVNSPHWEDFAEVNRRIREKCPDVIINNTCIGGRSIDTNTWEVTGNMVASLDARAEVASIDLSCFPTEMPMKARTAAIGDEREAYTRKGLYVMSYDEAEMITEEMNKRDIKPELELYNIQNLIYVNRLIAKGLLKGPLWIQVLFGGNGIFPTPSVMAELTRLLPPNTNFSVIGVGACQTAMITQGIIYGHHIRVGLEDNVMYGPKQPAESNAQLVARAVRICNELGRKVATPAEAREMMGLGAPRTW